MIIGRSVVLSLCIFLGFVENLIPETVKLNTTRALLQLILLLWRWRSEGHIDISFPLGSGGLRHQEVEFHGLADQNSGEVKAVLQSGLQDDIHLTPWCLVCYEIYDQPLSQVTWVLKDLQLATTMQDWNIKYRTNIFLNILNRLVKCFSEFCFTSVTQWNCVEI